MRKVMLVLFSLLLPLAAMAGPVNINTADAEAMSRELVGIGLTKAQAIVDYRTENGPFEVAEELLKVKGVGPRVLAANRENILLAD